MTAIWEEVLKLKPIGITDNFFHLGGDSIRSLQVRSLAKKQELNFNLQDIFNNPTIKTLAKHFENNSVERSSIKQTEPFELISADDKQLIPAGIVDAYPVAKLQSGMLFHSEFDQSATAYHNVTTYHLKVALDLEKLQEAINQVLQRHPVLRTSFDLFTFSEPLQLVHKKVAAEINFENIEDLETDQQNEAIKNWVKNEKLYPFDFTKAPLIRFKVHKRSRETFQFSFSEHHAIVDGWSVATMLTELFSIYFSSIEITEKPILPSPELTYRDFIAAEKNALNSEETKNFWLEKINDRIVTTVPRFPEEFREINYAGNKVKSVSLTKEVTAKLKEIAQKLEVPIKSVLFASHLYVLSVIGGQQEVLTGLVSNGRLEEEAGERVLGLFLNTLPFRTKLNNGTWKNLILDTFRKEKEILPHRWYPMAQLQKKSKTPLFETDFDFTHFHVYESLNDFKDILLDYSGYEETNFTLTANFSLDLNAEQIWLSLYYLPKYIASEQIDSISEYYLRTLEQIAANADRRYEEFSPLSDRERERIIEEFNDTNIEYESPDTIPESFSRQSLQNGAANAVSFGERTITYQELDEQSNQLAHYLKQFGIGIEQRVGVLMPRSIELVVSLLAILKTGAAYVPLDPTYPLERLRYMADDADLKLVISQGGEWQKILSTTESEELENNLRVIEWENESEQISTMSKQALNVEIEPESMAYMIYTSGSTGLPKGVQISHKALANFIYSMKNSPGISASDKLAAVTSLSFDIAGLELYLPLIAGAEIILIDQSTLKDGVSLINTIDEKDVSMMQATPSTWRLLIDAGWTGKNDLKILCGGEALSLELAKKLVSLGREVWNMYGPTETTIWSSIYKLEKDDELVSLGKPIANTRFYIVDKNINPVPLATEGELLIGGDGLSRGYFKRAGITSEKFIPDPFSSKAGEKLYKTGDLVRYLPNGKIEYMGRFDHQVKILGHRIELGEIESALNKHADIKEAIVSAKEDASSGNGKNNKKLVAYLTTVSDNAANQSELKRFLKNSLPDYMIPSTFVFLKEFPLTPNGKIDRKSLPEPG